MYDMSGFNYDITDVVHLLQLRVRHKNSSSMDVNCPFCGETKGKMNVNLQKNVFRCNRCDASGGMLELYGRLHGVSSAEANRQIREALGKGEYRTNYQVAPKKEPVVIFNAELADADVIDRTYQEMLSLLTLNDKHQEDLKKRGLTEEQIEIQRYRSVPLFGIKNMVQKLLESGQTVKGVPGFYEDQDGKPDEGKHNERKCYGCSHYTGMLTGSISNGRRYGTVREKYSCDYDISICPYAAGKV